MKTKVNVFDHPLHPMLVGIPIGLWVFSLAADALYLAGAPFPWREVGAYSLAGGCAGAAAAAIPGLIDYLSMKGNGPAKQTATWHMILNVMLVILYSANFLIRLDRGLEPAGWPLAMSIAGILMLGVSGWLGGHLVYKHKMGVSEPELESAGHNRISSHMSERQ